jgi:hypothetical protein
MLDHVDGSHVNANKHDAESKGANPRDHAHLRRPYWRHAHRDWRLWFAVMLMLAMIVVYVITQDLALRPGKGVHQPMPANNAP